MRLAYVTYGVGHARLVAYKPEKEKTFFIARFADSTNKESTATFHAFAPMIHLGPAMLAHDFALEAWDGEVIVGQCKGSFVDGLQLTEKSGYFEKVNPLPFAGEDHETIKASRSADGPGLSSTDIIVLSRKWERTHQSTIHIAVGESRIKWWNNHGLVEAEGGGDTRITGWSSSRQSTLVDLHCALVAVLSGPRQGEAGYLLWGDDGGIRVGGGEGGRIKGAALAPSLDNLPKRMHEPLKLPPVSVTQGSGKALSAL